MTDRYTLICDPSPCDPLALSHQVGQFGTVTVLLFVLAAFLAGKSLSRANFLLPILCMALIGATLHAHYVYGYKWTASGLGERSHEEQRGILDRKRQHLTEFNRRVYLNFALLPFAAGLALNVVQKRRRKPRA